jgi:hypothetical protein
LTENQADARREIGFDEGPRPALHAVQSQSYGGV